MNSVSDTSEFVYYRVYWQENSSWNGTPGDSWTSPLLPLNELIAYHLPGQNAYEPRRVKTVFVFEAPVPIEEQKKIKDSSAIKEKLNQPRIFAELSIEDFFRKDFIKLTNKSQYATNLYEGISLTGNIKYANYIT